VSILFCIAGVEIGLRATGNFAPASFHKLKPNSEFKDVETDWNVVYKTNSLDSATRTSGGEGKGLANSCSWYSFTFGQGCERGRLPDVLNHD
jgi:hypothetical protein